MSVTTDQDDTSVSEPTNEEAVDTSTNEDTSTEDSTDLEDMEISFNDVDDDEEAEDSEDETGDTEPTDTEEDSEEDETEEEPVEESKEEDTTSKEERQRQNTEAAARRVAEKQARERAKEEQQQKYLEDAEDNRDLALRQLQIDAYNNKVDRNRNMLDSGIEKAVASIDLFRTGTPEIKEELARRLEDFEAKNVTYDSNGDPIQVKGDVYEYLQTEADSLQRILQSGARTQTKAKEKAKARTETIPSRAPKESKVDPDLQAFDDEVAKWS